MANSDNAATERTTLDLLIRGFQGSQMISGYRRPRKSQIGSLRTDKQQRLISQRNGRRTPSTRSFVCSALWRLFTSLLSQPMKNVRHTERSRLLRKDTPGSMHYGARFWAGPGSWRAWGVLDRALKGEVPHEVAWGTDRFAYLRGHPEEARVSDDMMANFPDNRHAAVAETYDFSDVRLIVDVGGGNGAALSGTFWRVFPQPQGVLFDRQDLVNELSSTDFMDGRIEPMGGSFFERVPPAADLYILSRVLHDWSDEDCIKILRVCRSHMQPGSRLLIVEHIIEPDPTQGRPTDYLVDIPRPSAAEHCHHLRTRGSTFGVEGSISRDVPVRDLGCWE